MANDELNPHSEDGWKQVQAEVKAFGISFELGADRYDNSMEIYGVPPDWRPSIELTKLLFERWGFSRVYVNHTDGWETHYTKVEGDGWRVSYPFNRNSDGQGILVEKPVPSWPAEWFKTGYTKVVDTIKKLLP